MRPRVIAVPVLSALSAIGPSVHAQASEALQVRERWSIANGSVESGVDRTGAVSLRVDAGAWRRIGIGVVRAERVDLGGSAEGLIVRVDGDQPGLAVLVGGPSARVELVHGGPTITRGEDVSDRSVTDVMVRARPHI